MKNRLAQVGPLDIPLTTLGEEKHFNSFFRLGNPEIIAGLRQHFPDMPENPSPREVFVRLRELRNKW
jgi:hydroxyacylglutathione hydrolase